MSDTKSWQKAETLGQSFSHAWRGVKYASRMERNFVIQLVILAGVIGYSLVVRLSLLEVAVVILAAAVLLALEMVNTALEMLADVVQPAYHEKIGLLKDITAGAVLIMTVVAIVIGLLVFIPATVERWWLL